MICALACGEEPADLHQCLVRMIPDDNVEYATTLCGDLKAPSLLQWQISVIS